jgi:hypothetical protein
LSRDGCGIVNTYGGRIKYSLEADWISPFERRSIYNSADEPHSRGGVSPSDMAFALTSAICHVVATRHEDAACKRLPKTATSTPSQPKARCLGTGSATASTAESEGRWMVRRRIESENHTHRTTSSRDAGTRVRTRTQIRNVIVTVTAVQEAGSSHPRKDRRGTEAVQDLDAASCEVIQHLMAQGLPCDRKLAS